MVNANKQFFVFIILLSIIVIGCKLSYRILLWACCHCFFWPKTYCFRSCTSWKHVRFHLCLQNSLTVAFGYQFAFGVYHDTFCAYICGTMHIACCRYEQMCIDIAIATFETFHVNGLVNMLSLRLHDGCPHLHFPYCKPFFNASKRCGAYCFRI